MKVHCLIENSASGPGLEAEHGLSLLIESGGNRILFDAGASSAFARNADRMGIDLSAVNIAVLSHGHYDHGGGLLRFLEINSKSPLWASPHAVEPHFNASGKDIGLAPELIGHNRLRPIPADVLEIAPGITLHAACSIPQPYSAPAAGMSTLRGGIRVPDDFRHELYLLIEEKDRSILFSGCSHRGILNIVGHFRPDILVGGFHLMRTPPDGLPPIAAALSQFPTRYFTGHCTGELSYGYLKDRLGDRLHAFSTGSVWEL